MGRNPLKSCDWFDVERQVLLAAMAQASDTGFDAHAWQLPWTLALFFDRQGHWHDMAASQHIAIAAAQRLGDLAGQAHAYRDLARFLTGSALGLGVLAKTSPGRQALEGYVRVILSVLV